MYKIGILGARDAILGFMASVASIHIALFQFFWLIFVYLISRFMLM